MDRKDVLQGVVKRCIEGLGCEFVGMEGYPSGGTIRVYVDKPGGITVWDCTQVSRELRGVLLVEEPLAGERALEVSSPGLERPLFTPEQYQRVVGQRIKVYRTAPKEGRRIYEGPLLLVTKDSVEVQEAQGIQEILFSDIKKAHIVEKL